MMPHKREFGAVLQNLNLWREEALVQLRDPSVHAEALTLKLQLDAAIAALELCQRYQIRPEAPVTVLPELRTKSPSSAYRVAEDHESDDKANWVELEINDWHLELYPGDIILSLSKVGDVMAQGRTRWGTTKPCAEAHGYWAKTPGTHRCAGLRKHSSQSECAEGVVSGVCAQ